METSRKELRTKIWDTIVFYVKPVLAILGIAVAVVLCSWSINLINTPSTAAVILGFCVLTVVITFILSQIGRWIKKRNDNGS